ncbi:DNA repair protein RecN-like [Maniola hyperantus]|uniref:DNA repair protein RecN-like n=1 Tax=Aphantopus hyperantus TaxID=2795564 RepID=UPI00374909A5
MSEQKQLKQLIKKRAIIKGKLTNFSTYLKYLKQCEETDPIQIQIELQLRLEKLEALYDEFDSFQNEIEEISEAIEDECKERQTFETLYYSLVSSGRALIASHRKLSMPSHDSMVATDAEDSSDINKPLVKVLDSNGQSHAARILLDNGSTTNFVTKDFCRKLNLNTVSAKYKVLNCF